MTETVDVRMWIAPSALDSYQFFKDSGALSVQDFVRRICRLEPVSDAALAGTAFHAWVEQGGQKPAVWIINNQGERESWAVRGKDDVDIGVVLPDYSEFPVERTKTIAGIPVSVRGRVDGQIGNRLIEYKTTKAIDLEKYIGSWQWRAYLWIMREIRAVEYHVYKIARIQNREVVVVDQSRVVNHRYDELDAEFEAFLGEYVIFLAGLESERWITRTKSSTWLAGPRFYEWDEAEANERPGPDFDEGVR